MLKRSFSYLLITALCLAVIPDANALTVKAGAKCTKLKSTSVVKGKKYTCIKSGKKLVWNKGVAVKIAVTPTPKPTPSKSPAGTPIAIGDPADAIGGTPTVPLGQLMCPALDPADIEGITQTRADSLVGMTEENAQACAQSLEWEFRVGQRDSEMFPMTMDYRTNRVTVMVVLGAITSVNVG
jgi:hypothetical protein